VCILLVGEMAPNSLPVAFDDKETTDAETPVSDNMLENDVNPDVDALMNVRDVEGLPLNDGCLSIVLLSGASVTACANGTYVYDPMGVFASLPVDETVEDCFNYTMSNGAGSSPARVCVTVMTGVTLPISLPSVAPSLSPSTDPSFSSEVESLLPSFSPTEAFTSNNLPSVSPSTVPSNSFSEGTSSQPSHVPTDAVIVLGNDPSMSPSVAPTGSLSSSPSHGLLEEILIFGHDPLDEVKIYGRGFGTEYPSSFPSEVPSVSPTI